MLGGWQVLRDSVCGQGISVLVLAITGKIRPELFQAILDCQEMGVEVIRMPALYESLLGRVPIEYLERGLAADLFFRQRQPLRPLQPAQALPGYSDRARRVWPSE